MLSLEWDEDELAKEAKLRKKLRSGKISKKEYKKLLAEGDESDDEL